MFPSIYTTIIENIRKFFGKRSDWIIDSVSDHTMKIKKNIQSMYKKRCEVIHVDLLLIAEGDKKNYVFITDFNTFRYGHILHCGRKYFCLYSLKAFRTAEKLKYIIKDCFKTNAKQTIKMPRRIECVKFKNFDRKIKSSFMIYTDFESILVPEDNGKQNPNEPYTNRYQKHVACND